MFYFFNIRYEFQIRRVGFEIIYFLSLAKLPKDCVSKLLSRLFKCLTVFSYFSFVTAVSSQIFTLPGIYGLVINNNQ